MNAYVHHLPGRLRLRTAAVKRNPAAAALAREHLSSVAGVHAAETSAVTGSITIRYDPEVLSRDDVIGLLRRLGYAGQDLRLDMAAGAEQVINGYADGLAERLASMVVKKVLERSAVALIGALI